jgi:hypothetical protein
MREVIREVFLGKPWHWGLLLVIAAALWWAGSAKLHVIYFNGFVFALVAGTVAAVLLLVRTTKAGERVTRDALRDASDDAGD